jgi:4a-hydroxytetrahydrobiopterin dehydratase
MSLLSQVSCTEIRAGEPPASPEEISELHPFVPAWSLITEAGIQKLRNAYLFDGEESARLFVRLVEKIGRMENHRPEIRQEGGEVTVAWWSTRVKGLHPNDFIMAGKTDGAYTLVLVGAEGDMFTDEPLPRLVDLPRFRHTFAGRAPEKGKASDEA